MDKEERQAKLKKLKRERKFLLQNLYRVVKSKETKSALIVIKRAFKIIQFAIEIQKIQQELIVIVSHNNIQFPNGGPVAVHKDDIEKIVPGEFVHKMKFDSGQFTDLGILKK